MPHCCPTGQSRTLFGLGVVVVSLTKERSAQALVHLPCSPDSQYVHWSTQGDVDEQVWETNLLEDASHFADHLRSLPEDLTQCSPVSQQEVDVAAGLIKKGRSAGVD
eukprot:3306741-Karenia_brevis.AAC.1